MKLVLLQRRTCRWKRLRVIMAALFLAALLAAVNLSQQSPPAGASTQEFSAYLDDRMPKWMRQYGVPGASIALLRDGELVWSEAYGYADLENEREMTVDAVFRVESISKSLTAWGILRLVEEGWLDLNVPVQDYLHSWSLPETEYSEDDVPVRRRLSHNSGLPLGRIDLRYPPQSQIPTLRETLTQDERLINERGSGCSYANTGFDLLELVIEDVTGRDFAGFMAGEIMQPLGMQNSSFEWNETFNARIPTGYDLKGRAVQLYVTPTKGSGGLFATVEDIARFAIAEMGRAGDVSPVVLSPESIDLLHQPQVDVLDVYGLVSDGYGFGHFIEILPDGRRAVWHGGQGNGWMAHFHLVPESGDGIVILTNSQRSWPVFAQLLSAWARWSGFRTVKMGRITYGVAAVWALAGLFALTALWQAGQLILGLRRGTRSFAPFSSRSCTRRLILAVLGAGGAAACVWCAAQPYLLVLSIFPGAVDWAGMSLFILSVILFLSALFPLKDLLAARQTDARHRALALTGR